MSLDNISVFEELYACCIGTETLRNSRDTQHILYDQTRMFWSVCCPVFVRSFNWPGQ